jgi:hypothetical protein
MMFTPIVANFTAKKVLSTGIVGDFTVERVF